MTAPLPAWLEAFRRRLGAEVVETHISWLLLAGDTAWKLKKPVTLPFLDYGTPELRRHFCTEELRLNRRFAPGLYLGLDAVDGTGEWAVRMRRFPESQRLDHVCARGELASAACRISGRCRCTAWTRVLRRARDGRGASRRPRWSDTGTTASSSGAANPRTPHPISSSDAWGGVSEVISTRSMRPAMGWCSQICTGRAPCTAHRPRA